MSLLDDANSSSASVHLPRRTLLALLLILAVIWFGTLDYRKLIKPDEGRYAEIAREMMVSGNWITPRLNDLKYFEKPPLQYWATATAYEVFGLHEWTARLWTALTGFLGILFAGYTALRLYGRPVAIYTAAILASSLLYTLMGHLNTLDMALSFFMSATLFCTLLARQSGKSRWMLAAWGAMALAVLSKGLIGIVLPGAVLVVYLALSRDWALLKILELIKGSLLFLAITAPWFILVSIHNPEFAHFFFIHEHFERFLTTEHRRDGAWWYFVPILLAGSLPWLTVMGSALVSAMFKAERTKPSLFTLHESTHQRFKPSLLLSIWSVLIFIFFSVSGSKLPSYILPIFPALAVLTAKSLARLNRKHLMIHWTALIVLACIAFMQVIGTHYSFMEDSAAYYRYREVLRVCFEVWLVGLTLALLLTWKNHLTKGILTVACFSFLSWMGVLLGHEQLRGSTSAYDVSLIVGQELKNAPRNVPFYSVGTYDQTLNFYLGRTVTLVHFRDEMDFGLQQEPHKWVPDLATFQRRWSTEPQAFAIMAPDVFATLRNIDLPMRVVFQDKNRVIIAKTIQP